jgi:hypothetical protein
MVGSVNAQVIGNPGDWRYDAVAAGQVLISVELYRNCNPGLQPDWRNANSGIGGNCIACYQDAQCNYKSVASYLVDNHYVPGRDSVYGVGLTDDDWRRLAG